MYNSNYRKRAEQAIAHYQWPFTKRDVEFHERYCKEDGEFKPKKIKSVEDFLNAIEKRATTETESRDFFYKLCSILEPPSCSKTHCDYFTSFSFCNCSELRTPGKCKDNLQYLKRKKIKESLQPKE